MTLFWVTLLLFHQGYALVPVTTVQLGEPAILTCAWPKGELGSRALHWYKQSTGDTLKLIAVLKRNTKPVNGSEMTASRMEVKLNDKFSNLTILRTIQEDEGMYHCGVMDWTESTWSGTYLSLKGNTKSSSNYTVVQTVSDPVRPGDSVTLQCSVLSDSKNKTCPGDLSVFWFRAGSDKSHPDIIYTDGDISNKCEKRSETQKRCVYSFSKDISSSDDGTYYCAVATCGEILFGNGTKLKIESATGSAFIVLVVAVICLALSVIINIVLICRRTPRAVCGPSEVTDNSSSQARRDNLSQPVNDNTEDELNYAALRFSGAKATRGRKKKELKTEDCVYSQVTCRM